MKLWRRLFKKARKASVVRDFGTTVEVSDGVRGGDQVILSPPVDISESQAVNVRLVPSPKTS